MLAPPYLRAGVGRVLQVRGPPVVRLTGSAVQTGVPFGGQAAGLLVKWTDETGRPSAGNMESADVKLSGNNTVRLLRPVTTPRLRLAGRVVVAFKLQEFQFKAAPPFPARYEVRTFYDTSRPRTPHCLVLTLEVRRRGGRGPRLLWSLKNSSLVHLTWDGRHVWVQTNRGHQLRRLSDGAVMLSCDVDPPCREGGTWQVWEGTFVCMNGCCVYEPGGVVRHTGIEPAGDLYTIGFSPAGDRLVFQRLTTFDFYELLTRRPVPARRLEIPSPGPASFQLTAAGEVVWCEGDLLYVWKDGQQAAARTLDGVSRMNARRSYLLQLVTAAGRAQWH